MSSLYGQLQLIEEGLINLSPDRSGDTFPSRESQTAFVSSLGEVGPADIEVDKMPIDKKKLLGLYSPSGVFELKRLWAERHEEKDPCCEDKFADVT